MYPHSIALLLLLLLATARSAFSWGGEGHEIVALIALHDLKPVAKAKILQLFRFEDPSSASTLPELMMKASIWPDTIKQAPTTPLHIFKDINVLDAAQSHPLHFVDIEGTHYNPETDCPKSKCAITAIETCREVLGDPHQPSLARLEALKFLVHFVGDVHQPLHAGRRSDKGGNDITISTFLTRHPPSGFNLHEVWDKLIVEEADRDANRYALKLLGRITSSNRSTWAANLDPVAWVEESHKLAMTVAYRSGKSTPVTNGAAIDAKYYKRALPVVELQLEKAGVRLAAVINLAMGR